MAGWIKASAVDIIAKSIVNGSLTDDTVTVRTDILIGAIEKALEVRRGRNKRKPNPGERVQLSLRVTPGLKDRVDAKADETGRSQSQEAEFHIERSLLLDQLIEARLMPQTTASEIVDFGDEKAKRVSKAAH